MIPRICTPEPKLQEKEANPLETQSAKVLVVDDEATMRNVLELRLQKWGFEVVLAGETGDVPKLLAEENPDVILSDVVMPDMSGLELLRKLKNADPDRPVILLTAHATVEMAVEAMKEGALDFLTKPINYANLRAVLAQACRDREILSRSSREKQDQGTDIGFGPFIGTSGPMQEIYATIRSLAQSDAPVLITGESGTGKELAASAIHRESLRGEGPFIAVNTAAIPRELMASEIFGHERGAFTGASRDREGCFELAHRGTLFLDEISEMPLELQPKLLRVLDDTRFRRVGGKREISVNVRTLSATNRDPRKAVADGILREDLYYRLNVFTLKLPPLRERTGDISLITEHFLQEFGKKHKSPARAIRDETLEIMEAYRWPGNVRELRNVVERATVLAEGEWIEPSHLPAYVRSSEPELEAEIAVPSGLSMAEVEKRLILRTLDETGNNKAATARRLGLNVKTIRNKLKSYGLDR